MKKLLLISIFILNSYAYGMEGLGAPEEENNVSMESKSDGLEEYDAVFGRLSYQKPLIVGNFGVYRDLFNVGKVQKKRKHDVINSNNVVAPPSIKAQRQAAMRDAKAKKIKENGLNNRMFTLLFPTEVDGEQEPSYNRDEIIPLQTLRENEYKLKIEFEDYMKTLDQQPSNDEEFESDDPSEKSL